LNSLIVTAKATIRDVATKANVGIATVSRVLNDSPAVKPDTRERVLAAIDELGYVPHSTARRLSLGRTLTIAVMVPFLTRPSTVERLRGVQKALSTSEYDLVLFIVESPGQRDECFEQLTSRARVDGLLTISLRPTDEQANRILDAGLPTVLVDAPHPALSRVVVDDFQGGYLATRHLMELGHRRIAFLGDYLDNEFDFISMRRRFEGFKSAHQELGIPSDPALHAEGEHGRPEAAGMAERLISLEDPPTAIFAASDTQAFGVLDAARSQGLVVPEALSVIGYDDVELAEYMELTTIRQPLYETGYQGGQMLLDALEENTADLSAQELRLPFDLVVRGTTGPVPEEK
jgi:DNA-binding LacI/PurR family transcriptional regulator